MPDRRLPYAVLGWLLATGTATIAKPPDIAAPPGARLVLQVEGQGVQIYACQKVGDSYHWSFKAPEAALFDRTGRQVGTHFAGPTWQSADGSKIVGELVAQAPAPEPPAPEPHAPEPHAPEPHAPEPHAIAWLLLRVKSHEGSGVFSQVELVRRVDTHGGIAPAAGCDAAQTAAEARMRYTARYLFYAVPH